MLMADGKYVSEEFVVRVPSFDEKKKWTLFRFNGNLNEDVTRWSQVTLDRENNANVYVEEDMAPKFGAGSVFGQQMRAEARRKKLGYATTQYRRSDQPWLLTVSGKEQEKKYRGLREGSVSQNADYWVFVKSADKVFDAIPVAEWYNFQPVSRYKTLDIDEAEEQFLKRDRILNQFALKATVRTGDAEGQDEAKPDTTTKSREKSGDDDLDAEDGEYKAPKRVAVKKQKPPKKPKKKNENAEDEIASAESDDGDEEGREVDYISSSESESENEFEKSTEAQELIGVDEEVGMRVMLSDTDEEEAEEEENEGQEKAFDLSKLDSIQSSGFGDAEERDSDSSSDSDDPDREDIKSALFMQVKSLVPETSSAGPSGGDVGNGAEGIAASKRKVADSEADAGLRKKAKAEKRDEKGTRLFDEEEVRRHLERKPLSTTELVAKFKPRCTGMKKHEIVQRLADILKRLKPNQFRRNNVLYFSLAKK